MINKKQVLIASAVLFSVVLAAALLINAFKKSDSLPDGYYTMAQNKWPETVHTEGFPELDGDIYSVLVNDNSTAVFIRGVDKATADSYSSILTDTGLVFTPEKYPKTAETENLFITLAYDEATYRFSVTFSLKEPTGE